MPDHEELEERLDFFLEGVLLSRTELDALRNLIRQENGMQKVNELLNRRNNRKAGMKIGNISGLDSCQSGKQDN